MIALLLGLGCGPADVADMPAQYRACEVDADCEVVQLGCCDHCNGGEAVSVHRGWVDVVLDEYHERCGGSFACTDMGCNPLEAVCGEDALCALEIVEF